MTWRNCLMIVDPVEEDRIVAQFLKLLAEDVLAYQERLVDVDANLVERGRSLSKGVKFDMDEALLPQNE